MKPMKTSFLSSTTEQWVAIFDGHIVGTASDVRQLLALLDEKNVPSERAFIQLVTTNADLLILAA